MPLDEVKLDPKNPRIANTVAIGASETGAALQKKLEGLLWEDDDVRDLYRQVLINKGLVERIIVRRDGTAVEGNCRTVVYRKLREKFPSDHLPTILENPEAVIALTESGFAEAQRAIAEDNPAVTSKLFKRMVEMTDALKRAQLDDIQRVRKQGNSKANLRLPNDCQR